MLIVMIWLGFMLDLLLGDPEYRWHPIRLIGHGISTLEKYIRQFFFSPKALKFAGVGLVIAIVGGTYFITWILIEVIFKINVYLAFVFEMVLIYTFLALRGLMDAVIYVKNILLKNNLHDARKALSMIVGRDTKDLTEDEVIKASIETLSENSVDGVIAPLFYGFIGGVPLMAAYKAINTLDSMVGYQNSQYQDLGWCSAKLDDLANFIPARLSLIFLTISAFILKLDYKEAWHIGWRDRYQHKSPNSAWSEAATAGALGIQLGGSHYYSGILVEKPTIGEALHSISLGMIKTTVKLIVLASFLALLIFSIVSFMLL